MDLLGVSSLLQKLKEESKLSLDDVSGIALDTIVKMAGQSPDHESFVAHIKISLLLLRNSIIHLKFHLWKKILNDPLTCLSGQEVRALLEKLMKGKDSPHTRFKFIRQFVTHRKLAPYVYVPLEPYLAQNRPFFKIVGWCDRNEKGMEIMRMIAYSSRIALDVPTRMMYACCGKDPLLPHWFITHHYSQLKPFVGDFLVYCAEQGNLQMVHRLLTFRGDIKDDELARAIQSSYKYPEVVGRLKEEKKDRTNSR